MVSFLLIFDIIKLRQIICNSVAEGIDEYNLVNNLSFGQSVTFRLVTAVFYGSVDHLHDFFDWADSN